MLLDERKLLQRGQYIFKPVDGVIMLVITPSKRLLKMLKVLLLLNCILIQSFPLSSSIPKKISKKERLSVANESDITSSEQGFLELSSRSLPEKKGLKRRRDQERLQIRFERQAERVHKNRIKKNYGNRCVLQEIAESMEASKSSKEMYDIMEESNLSQRDETDLLRLLGSRCSYKEMLFLLDRSMHKPSVHSYTSVIASLAQSTSMNDRRKALNVLDTMFDKGIMPNSFTFTAAFLAVDSPSTTMNIMERMNIIENETRFKNMESIFNIFTYNAAIHSCSRGKSNQGFDTAYQLYQTMKKKQIQPNDKTISSLLHCATKSITFSRNQRIKQTIMNTAIKIIDDIPSNQLSPKSWGAALSVCSAAMDDKKAKQIFDQMGKLKCLKNIMHYNQYLSALAKAGKDHLVWDVFQQMMDDPNVMPEIVTLNTVLGAFSRTANYDRASLLLSQMKKGQFIVSKKRKGSMNQQIIQKSIFPDTISYNSVLSACSDAKEALQLVNEMRLSRRSRTNQQSITPTAVTYTNAITACRKSNPPDLQTAKHLFYTATKKDAIIPNVFMYSALIWTAERCKNPEEALLIFQDMKSQGCKPNIVSYDGVLAAFVNQVLEGSYQALETSIKIYEEMKMENTIPTTVTFQKLALAINSYFSNTKDENKIILLERIYSIMSHQERRLHLGGPIIKSLILAYANAKRYDDAKRVFDSIVGVIDIQATSAMLYACSLSAQWETAILLVEQYAQYTKMKGSQVFVDPMLLNYAVIACSKQNKWEEALNLIDRYYKHSENGQSTMTLSVAALNALTASCGRCGRPDVAVTILNDMISKYGVTPDERSYRSVIIACNQAEHEIQRNKYKKFDEEDFDDTFELQWWECSLSLLRRMQEEDLTPDIQTYSSVISACQAAGQWQRAIGVLESVPIENNNWKEATSSLNLFCCNAAIAACEKGGAWIEALSLYEKVKSNPKMKPNFITINSLIIALDRSYQKELADSIYEEARRDGIIMPWKYRFVDSNDEKVRVLDLHQFSVPMAKVAVTNVMESLLRAYPIHDKNNDLIIIVGKGKGSDKAKGPVLLPVVVNLLKSEYDVDVYFEESNSGRIRITSDSLYKFTTERSWRSWYEQEEDSV